MRHGTRLPPRHRQGLKRAEGHLRSVIAMIEAGRPCVDLAQQLHAVESAVTNAKRELDPRPHRALPGRRAAKRDLDELKQLARYLLGAPDGHRHPAGRRAANAHSHMWLMGLVGVAVGAAMMICLPRLRIATASILLFAAFHVVGAVVLLVSAWVLGLRNLLRRSGRRAQDALRLRLGPRMDERPGHRRPGGV